MTDFTDVWYKSSDGLILYARDYEPEKKPGDEDITIICIPGMTRNAADFHELALHLQNSYRVISVDLRGRGRSSYDKISSNYNPATYVADIAALIKELELGSILFIGTSLGGLISMLISATTPEYVKGIIINDFAPEIQQSGLRRIQSYVGKAAPVQNWDEAVAQAKQFNGKELPDLSDENWLAFARNVYRNNAAGIPVLDYDPAISEPFTSHAGNAELATLWPVYDALPQIPILLIRGELSDIVSSQCVAEMQRRRKNLQYAEIRGRGHAPLLNEPEALQAIDKLLQFL